MMESSQSEIRFIENEKGGKLLIFDGYIFQKQKLIKSSTYFICFKRKQESCKASIILDNYDQETESYSKLTVVNRDSDSDSDLHSHGPDIEKIKRLEAQALTRKIVSENKDKTPKEIVRLVEEQVHGITDEVEMEGDLSGGKTSVPLKGSMSSLGRLVRRARQKVLRRDEDSSDLPETRNEEELIKLEEDNTQIQGEKGVCGEDVCLFCLQVLPPALSSSSLETPVPYGEDLKIILNDPVKNKSAFSLISTYLQINFNNENEIISKFIRGKCLPLCVKCQNLYQEVYQLHLQVKELENQIRGRVDLIISLICESGDKPEGGKSVNLSAQGVDLFRRKVLDANRNLTRVTKPKTTRKDLTELLVPIQEIKIEPNQYAPCGADEGPDISWEEHMDVDDEHHDYDQLDTLLTSGTEIDELFQEEGNSTLAQTTSETGNESRARRSLKCEQVVDKISDDDDDESETPRKSKKKTIRKDDIDVDEDYSCNYNLEEGEEEQGSSSPELDSESDSDSSYKTRARSKPKRVSKSRKKPKPKTNKKSQAGTYNDSLTRKCHICEVSIEGYKLLREHYSETHPEAKLFNCVHCNKHFSLLNRLWRHQRGCGTRDRPFVCDICGRRLGSEVMLKRHKCKVHGINSFLVNTGNALVPKGELHYNCHLCEVELKGPACVRRHYAEVHPEEKKYTCKFCQKHFVHLRHVEGHQRKHTGEKPLSCEICNKTFYSDRAIKYHNRLYHNPDAESFPCEKCEKTFSTQRILQNHLLTHDAKVVVCLTCGGHYVSKTAFGVHNKRYHGGLAESSEPTDDLSEKKLKSLGVQPKGRLKCFVCWAVIPGTKNIEVHFQEFHPGKSMYHCTHCEKSYPDYRRTMRHVHRHFGDRTVQCDKCPMAFFTQYDLTLHSRSHIPTEERFKHICDVCGAKFVSRFTLRHHSRKHEPDGGASKNWICEDCGNVYTERKSYMHHKKSAHSEVLEYKCPHCPKECAFRWELTKHMNTHAVQKPFKCPHCDLRFPYTSSRLRHVKEIHQNIKIRRGKSTRRKRIPPTVQDEEPRQLGRQETESSQLGVNNGSQFSEIEKKHDGEVKMDQPDITLPIESPPGVEMILDSGDSFLLLRSGSLSDHLYRYLTTGLNNWRKSQSDNGAWLLHFNQGKQKRQLKVCEIIKWFQRGKGPTMIAHLNP